MRVRSTPPRRWAEALRSPLGAGAAALLGIVLLTAVLAPVLWTVRANAVDTDAISQGLSSRHLLGTDSLGRDVLHRVLVATRLSVRLALQATAIGVFTGVMLGAAPWLLGRRAGRLATA